MYAHSFEDRAKIQCQLNCTTLHHMLQYLCDKQKWLMADKRESQLKPAQQSSLLQI